MANKEPRLPRDIPLQGGTLSLFEHIDLPEPDLMDRLVSETEWTQEDITLFGKTMPQPRLIAYYGDADAAYTYSRKRYEPRPWTSYLGQLRQAVENLSGASFNSVLLNYYRDGNDSMGLHADDEPELGDTPVIASLSLGQERKIYFQHKHRKDVDNLVLPLPHSSLLIMAGATQHNWKHGVRKVRGHCGPRLNLTFRLVRFASQ
ncbi:MAG: alpha-ketoglutarate-dependent dioxygenase AlkB family protein [Halioglobus sp.]